MTGSALKEVTCWNCEEVNSVTYGGEADDGIERCDNCNQVIAEAEVDTITLPQKKEHAIAIQKRTNSFNRKERLLKMLGRL